MYDLWQYKLGHPGKTKIEQIMNSTLLAPPKCINTSL